MRSSKASISSAASRPQPTSATRLLPSTSATSPPWALRRGMRCCRSSCRRISPSPTSMACSTGCIEVAEANNVTLVGGNITRSPGPLVVDVTVDRSRAPAANPDAEWWPAGRSPLRQRHDWRRSGRTWLAARARRSRRRPARGFRTGAVRPAGIDVRSRGRGSARFWAGRGLRRRAWTSATALPTPSGRSPKRAGSARGSSAGALPVHEARDGGSRETAATRWRPQLSGGDDYELLFAVSEPRPRTAAARHATGPRRCNDQNRRVDRRTDHAHRADGGGIEPLPAGFVHF